MLRWYWYLCGSILAKRTALLRDHQDEDYEMWRRPHVARGLLYFAAETPRAPAVPTTLPMTTTLSASASGGFPPSIRITQ